MSIESEADVIGLLRAGRAVSEAIRFAKEAARPGMSTAELDHSVRKILERHGARSAPELTYGFPGAACISLNDAAAHGMPSPDVFIAAGDLINVDVSAELDGYYADSGHSFVIDGGRNAARDAQLRRLCSHAYATLCKAVNAMRHGARLADIGGLIEAEARNGGYTVIRNLCSHGVGRALHEEPREIYNYRHPRDRRTLREGMVLTMEPFVSERATSVQLDPDGWTLRTPDGSCAAQHEFTLIVTKGKPVIVTPIDPCIQ